jgi:hypothetical protein
MRLTMLLASLSLAAACGGEEPLFETDAGQSLDAGAPPDAGEAADATVSDAALPDAAPLDAGPVDGGCRFDRLPPADRDRAVLIGHPFGAAAGQAGTAIRRLTLRRDGTLVDTRERLDVGQPPGRIAFTPDGTVAVVVGQSGRLVSLRLDGQRFTIADTLELPAADYGDLHFTGDGGTLFVVGTNVDTTVGVFAVQLGCEGELTLDVEAFFALRLASSLAFLPGEQRAVLLGGQAVFEPVDPDDLRLLERSGRGWRQVAAFDLWGDFIDAERIAVSPDGRTLLVPNGSAFSDEGQQVMVASIDGDVLSEVRRIPNADDAREALFSPDGSTALVTLLEPGQLMVLADRGAGFVETGRVRGIGVPEQLAMVRRGSLAGRVLAPSVDPGGSPNVAQLQFEGQGMVRDLGQLDLGPGFEEIPGAIAVEP